MAWPRCRKHKSIKCSALTETHILHSLHPMSWDHCEGGDRKNVRARVVDNYKETVSFGDNGTVAPMKS